MPSRLAPAVSVYLDGTLEPRARVLTVKQSLGGRQPDLATFTLERPGHRRAGYNTRDYEQQDGWAPVEAFENQTCEIVVTTGAGPVCVHFGRVVGGDTRLVGDEIRYTSRLDDHLFGAPLVTGEYKLYPGGATATLTHDGRQVFNPVVDGRALPNCWRYTPARSYSVLIDPDSLPWTTFDDLASLGIPQLQYWNLAEIVAYLCRRLNAAETYVANPTYSDLAAAVGTDPGLVRDWEPRIGARLPQLLDSLLEPFGYSWRVKYEALGRRRLVLWDRLDPIPLDLGLQGVGQDVNPDFSTVCDLRLAVDHVHQAANTVLALGDYQEVEATWELIPAWAPEYDSYQATDLALDGAAVDETPALARVWRDWVLNEGGDYNGRRPPTATYGERLKAAADLRLVFGHSGYSTHRRRLLPMLTLADDRTPYGAHDGVLVEWHDGTMWRPVSDLANQSVQILTRECGIRFANAAGPPQEMVALGIDTVKVRVTATLRDDFRIRGSAGAGTSALVDLRQQVVDAGTSYRHRRVSTLSIMSADVRAGRRLAAEADDRAALQDFAERVYQAWNQSSLGGELELEGVDYAIDWLSHSIRSIIPRDISLRATVAGVATDRYPTAVAVQWDFQAQRTTLRLDTPREARYQ